MKAYVIGIDFGSDSVRAVVADTADGKELSQAVCYYPRWAKGLYCNPVENRFRQHPLDYIESMEKSVVEALKKAPKGSSKFVKGISVDTTGSTPVAVDSNGVPLALNKKFRNNPNAMFILWKDHTAVKEAAEINKKAKSWGGTDFTKYSGGIYSSEWFWSKIIHTIRKDRAVYKAAYSWMEHCDWIPALLTGVSKVSDIKRSRCAAGHKAMWNAAWGGLPSEEFLVKLEPKLKGLRKKLYDKTFTADEKAGYLSPVWAKKFGLSTGVAVGAGAFDAHIGAVGACIVPYSLVRIMGTSTCDILTSPGKDIKGKVVKGICGQVDGSVEPGLIGLEAGQSAFGDIYAWFRDLLAGPLKDFAEGNKNIKGSKKKEFTDAYKKSIITYLSKEAAKISAGESALVALDWMNGRRTPDANQMLKGALTGLTLGSSAPRVFRALVEATAFGSRSIVERFKSEGIKVNSIIGIGGVSKKSPFVMQVLSDVLKMPIKVASSEQCCALGAAMCASVAAGVYKDIPEAKKKMGSGFDATYRPNKKNNRIYDELYKEYRKLGAFAEKNTRS